MLNGFKTKKSAVYSAVYNYRFDIIIAIILMIVAGFFAYLAAQLIHPLLFQTNNVWFQADTARNFEEMTDYYGYAGIKSHPLFPIIAYSLVKIVMAGWVFESIPAVNIVIASIASLWIATLYILLRLIDCQRLDATLLSLLAATSAAAIFWFVVPETYPFGSLSILMALCLVALAQKRRVSWFWYVVINVLTLSFLITNWMVGILATITRYQWKKTLIITGGSCILVIVLFVGQNIFYSSYSPSYPLVKQPINFLPKQKQTDSAFTLAPKTKRRIDNLLPPEAGGPFNVTKILVFNSMVMPDIQKAPNPDYPLPRLTIQRTIFGSGSLYGNVAVLFWSAILALGLWSFFTIKKYRQFRFVLGFTILGQFALYNLFGDETFLYTLNVMPLLIVLAAFTTLTRFRLLALVLAVVLLLSLGTNNIRQFINAIELVRNFSH